MRDDQMPSDEDIAQLHREIQVKGIMYGALQAASDKPLPGLPLSRRGQKTVAILLKRPDLMPE